MKKNLFYGVATACLLGTIACDSTPTLINPTGLSVVVPDVSIRPPIQPPPAFVGSMDGPRSQLCDLVVSASSTGDLNHVTMQMIDGSNLGGSTVGRTPIDLSRQITNRRVVAGTTRTFPLTLPVGFLPQTLGATVLFVDALGVSHSITARGACP